MRDAGCASDARESPRSCMQRGGARKACGAASAQSMCHTSVLLNTPGWNVNAMILITIYGHPNEVMSFKDRPRATLTPASTRRTHLQQLISLYFAPSRSPPLPSHSFTLFSLHPQMSVQVRHRRPRGASPSLPQTVERYSEDDKVGRLIWDRPVRQLPCCAARMPSSEVLADDSHNQHRGLARFSSSLPVKLACLQSSPDRPALDDERRYVDTRCPGTVSSSKTC